MLREELEKACLMPAIQSIIDIREKLGVESWSVMTDRGERTFEARDARRNVREIGRGRLLIEDVDASRYGIPGWRSPGRSAIALLMPRL